MINVKSEKMGIRVFQAVVAAIALTAFGSANATVHTYNFTSVVDSLWMFDFGENKNFNAATLDILGTNISQDEIVAGTFSYDTASSPLAITSSGNGYYSYTAGITSFSINLPASGFSFAAKAGGTIQAGNDVDPFGWDVFNLEAISPYVFGSVFQILRLSFFDNTGSLLNSTELPDVLDLSRLSYAQFSYGSVNTITNEQRNFFGQVTSLTAVSPIPEPGTYTMLLTGLVFTGIIAARRRRTQLAGRL